MSKIYEATLNLYLTHLNSFVKNLKVKVTHNKYIALSPTQPKAAL